MDPLSTLTSFIRGDAPIVLGGNQIILNPLLHSLFHYNSFKKYRLDFLWARSSGRHCSSSDAISSELSALRSAAWILVLPLSLWT